MVELAILGMFRSGTNFVRTVMELNYECSLLNTAFGWKHGFYPAISKLAKMEYPDIPVLVVVRRPTLALFSLHRYYVDRHVNIRAASDDFSAFLRGRIVFFNEHDPYSPQFRFSNPVQMWNGMNWNYASVKPNGQPLVIVRYEDMLADPEAVAQSVAERLGLKRKDSDRLFVPENRTKNMSDRPRARVGQYLTGKSFEDKELFLDGGYLSAFSREDLEFIRREADRELLRRLGYAEP